MITSKTIKEEIKSCIIQIEQWSERKEYGRMYKYSIKLETLVELLEVDNCGSVGGFDKGQNPLKNYSLIQRAKYVVTK